MKTLTKKKLIAFIKDEKKAFKEYSEYGLGYGLRDLAEDERRHYYHLMMLSKMI